MNQGQPHAAPVTTPQGGGIKGIIGGIIVVVMIFVMIVFAYITRDDDEEPPAQTASTAAPTLVIRKVVDPVYATTPTTITADYAYNLESDAPIMVKYPGEKAFLFTPGSGCQDLPEPRRSGPKKFWDPQDEKGGRIHFRLYPVGSRCP